MMKTMKYTTTGPLADMAPAWVHAHERGETLPGMEGMEITQDGGREAGILWRTWTATTTGIAMAVSCTGWRVTCTGRR